MDWKKEFREHLAIACRFNPKEPIYGEENRRDLNNIEAFIQSLLEDLAKETIGREYSKYRLDKEMKGVEQPHKTGLLGKRHGYNQHRQEVIDTFKEYGIIIK